MANRVTKRCRRRFVGVVPRGWYLSDRIRESVVRGAESQVGTGGTVGITYEAISRRCYPLGIHWSSRSSDAGASPSRWPRMHMMATSRALVEVQFPIPSRRWIVGTATEHLAQPLEVVRFKQLGASISGERMLRSGCREKDSVPGGAEVTGRVLRVVEAAIVMANGQASRGWGTKGSRRRV